MSSIRRNIIRTIAAVLFDRQLARFPVASVGTSLPGVDVALNLHDVGTQPTQANLQDSVWVKFR